MVKVFICIKKPLPVGKGFFYLENSGRGGKSMENKQHLLEAIVKEAVKLTLLVKANGLNSNQSIMQSEKLDDLILTYQQQKRGEIT